MRLVGRPLQLVELGEARARLRCLGRLRQLVLVRRDGLSHPLDRLVEPHALDVRVEDVGAADVLAAALEQHLADRLVLAAVGPEPGLDRAAEVVAQGAAQDSASAAGVGVVEPVHLGVVAALVERRARHEALADRVLLYTDDTDADVEWLRARTAVEPALLIRRSTLEDVFLALTGRTLEEV